MYKIFIALIGILIVFSSAKVKAQEASGDADTVLRKIKEKVEAIRNSPKAYIGTITDKTGASLQVKDTEGKIQQISVNDSVKFIRSGSNQKEINYTEVAIGDYIAALGITSEGNILEAKRILLISPITEPARKIYFAEITLLSKKELKIKDKDGNETAVTLPRRWKGPDVSDLEIGMSVILVTSELDGKNNLRTIEIIKTEPQTP